MSKPLNCAYATQLPTRIQRILYENMLKCLYAKLSKFVIRAYTSI